MSSDEFRAILTQWKAKPGVDTDAATFIEAWADKDPEAAAKFMTDFPNLSLRCALARVWARKDRAAALAWVQTLPGAERLSYLYAVQQGDFESGGPNPLAIIEEVRKSPESPLTADPKNLPFAPPSRKETVRSLLALWAERDPRAAQTFAQGLPPDEREAAMIAILTNLLETDPLASVGIYKQFTYTNETIRQRHVVRIAAKLAAVSVDEAIAFVATEPAGLTRSAALAGIATTLFDSHPDDAIAILDGIPLDDSSALESFFWAISQTDPVAAVQLSARRLDQLEPGSAAAKQLQAQLEKDLTGFQQADYARSIAPILAANTSPDRQRALVGLMGHWIATDPQTAAAWMQSLPAGTAREYAVIGTAQAQVQQNAKQAVEWMKALPASDYGAAVEGFASGAFAQDPDGALAWLRTITDPAERARRLVAAWQRWVDQGGGPNGIGANAPERWRDTSPDLTPAERALLVRQKE